MIDAPRLFPVQQHNGTSDDYYTPAWVFETMGIEFDLDVCAPPGGIPWIPAARYFDMEADGLAQSWQGRVWMNPPFSRIGAAGADAATRRANKPSGIGPWVARFIANHDGIALLPISRAKWFQDVWAVVDGVVPLPSSFLFVRPGHTANKDRHPFMPLFVAAFGDECVEAISRLGKVRR